MTHDQDRSVLILGVLMSAVVMWGTFGSSLLALLVLVGGIYILLKCRED